MVDLDELSGPDAPPFPLLPWDEGAPPDAAWALARYEAVRARLPVATFPAAAVSAPGLLAIAHAFDTFVLDAFGVLNVGEDPVPSALETITELANAGKTLIVLSNGATRDADAALTKYRALGFNFEPEQICSSRNALELALQAYPDGMRWGFAAPIYANIQTFGVPCCHLGDDAAAYDQVDGFVYLGQRDWTPDRQTLLEAAIRKRPRPVLCGNPDLVAPVGSGFSIEPGAFAHALADRCGIEVTFLGKPFGNAFDLALERATAHLGGKVDKGRTAMVGDTLHTDIIGGAAAGLRTVLVTDHGLFRGLDARPYMASSGIVPDYVVPTT